MKVYTKKGDSGKTSLIGGTRVSKHHVKIDAYGTVDELNSYIGLIRDSIEDKVVIEHLIEIQDRLFTIGSLLASDGKNKMNLPPLKEEDIANLEQQIDEMDKGLEPMRAFVLPGGNTVVSFSHIARCVCRRAERKAVHLADLEVVDEKILAYLNRLSDFLFILSRKFTKDLNAIEIEWKPRM